MCVRRVYLSSRCYSSLQPATTRRYQSPQRDQLFFLLFPTIIATFGCIDCKPEYQQQQFNESRIAQGRKENKTTASQYRSIEESKEKKKE